MVLDEAPSWCEKTPGVEEESGEQVTSHPGLLLFQQEQHREEQHLKSVVRTCTNNILCVCQHVITSGYPSVKYS